MAAETDKIEPADSEQDEGEDVYEVERIIDMRVEEGEVLYRVRWKNYCSDDDTWEPEAHLEDCGEVLLTFKKNMAEVKAKKEAEAKKSVQKPLPTKSDVFDADSESDSDKDRPNVAPIKKKKKAKLKEAEEEDEEEEPLPKDKKKKKKKDKRKEDFRPLPAPETDEEDERAQTPPPPPKEKKTESKKRLVDSDDEDIEPTPVKKHKKEKVKEGGKHKKDKPEDGKKKKGKKDRKIESSEDEATAPIEEDLSDGPSETQASDSAPTEKAAKSAEKARLEEKVKQKKGKWEVKLQGIKDFIHDKKSKKTDTPLKESSLQKLKNLTSKSKDETAPLSDSSDSSTLHRKAKSKGQESTPAPPKVPSSSTSSSSSSSSVTAASSTKGKEEETAKEEVLGQKDTTGSTNLFEKFLLNCEAKDRAPRRQPVHQPTPEKGLSKPTKIIGKIEKISKPTKESPAQKPEPEKTEKPKQSEAPKSGHSHGFNLDSDEREDEPTPKPRFGEDSRERRERQEEAQRPSWERRTSADDRRKRREDSEPRLFMACDDNQDIQDPAEGADKSDKGHATLSLGMDLNLDWMTLDDFQKHLNGEDEILSGPPLSPSELRDAVKSGDYMAVKLALNSKEDYNLDQEACTMGETRSFEAEKSLIEERSSSDPLRLTSNLGSGRNEEGTPDANINFPQDLDFLIAGQKINNLTSNTNSEQVTFGDHKNIKNSGQDVTGLSDTGCNSATKQDDPGKKKQRVTREGQKSDNLENGLSSKKGVNVDHPTQTTTTGMVLRKRKERKVVPTKQSSSEEEKDSNDEAEEGQSDNSDQALNKKGIAKTQSRRRRKTVERKQPTRSSSRASKKVTETKPSTDDEEKKDSGKKHFCLYCKQAFTQIAKHLERKHAEEADVSHAVHFPRGSKVRQNLLDQIRNKGDYEHNCKVLKSGEGEIVTKKQVKNPSISVRDYLPCQHCFAFYRKTDLWRHERSCKARKGEQKSSEKTKRTSVHIAASRLLPMSEFLTGGCEEIIHIMHQDDISRHIRNDPLICKYGNALSAKYDHDKSQFAYIAQKMRELGRFVLAVNELDKSVKYLHEICLPSRFELAVEGAKKASGFDPSSSKFKTVSLVSKIGYSLKRAAEIAFGESRMTEDSETESEVKTFIQLLDTKWSECFSRKALALSLKQEVKKVEIDKSTLTEDLVILHKFIIGEEDEAQRELKESPSLSTWKKLSEATLADVCLFNRGRVGNIGRMLLKPYTQRKSRETFVLSADQIRRCTKLELDLGASFTRVELEGQYGRNMLVLLTERMVSSIKLIIENREQAGVANTNPYLFARTEGPSFIRGLDCLRRAAVECGVKNPEALLSSSLREQIASCWQLMSLSENELDRVAKLVGRSSQECYGLSNNASQLEEISKQVLKLDRTLPSGQTSTTTDGVKEDSALLSIFLGTPQKPPLKRRPWSEKEQAAVKRYLSAFITAMKVPGKKDCNACIAAEPDLCGRSWTDVKNYVHNTLQTVRRRNKSDGNTNESPKAVPVQTPKPELEDTSICPLTTVNLDHIRESPTCCMSMALPTNMRDSSMSYSQDMTQSYATLCSTSTNLVHSSQQLISTFTPLNSTDTQVVPTYTPHNTTNSLMSPAYTSENNMMMPMSSAYTHHNANMPPPSAYTPHDPTNMHMIPNYTTFNAPSNSMGPTYTSLNTASPPMIPAYSTLNDRSRPVVSSFTPLNHPSTPPYLTNQPRDPTMAQVVPTIQRPNIPERTPAVQESKAKSSAGKQATSAVKPQKRNKRLWSEEEQAAVRRQFGDFCKLMKVPGKKDCDACLAAEPALNTRTWREVKYFVHNSIQSLKRRGHPVASKQIVEPEPETHNPNPEWDGPVYLSL
ncbi:M-phase phosphoprotein 8 isoform X2 [Cheilinus undulatus]|uniref:M-phase phosphoprotein 8 isoform X2 n=1 Tax=Cheilinus undulatus TaxID=241271 RepID=UPI001BD65B17|nr:M-phase phosphoprotein 8 isoform X2 [Cheilinus undulatus]